MNSITEYCTYGIKVRPSIFLQFVCTFLTISNNPETSIACYYSFFSSNTARYLLMGSSFNEFLLSPLQLKLVILVGS